MKKFYQTVKKQNDEIRLVINLIAINDIVNKYEYKLANLGDIVRET